MATLKECCHDTRDKIRAAFGSDTNGRVMSLMSEYFVRSDKVFEEARRAG